MASQIDTQMVSNFTIILQILIVKYKSYASTHKLTKPMNLKSTQQVFSIYATSDLIRR